MLHEWRYSRPSAISDSWRRCECFVQRSRNGTHETQPIRVWVTRDVFHQVTTRSPNRNKLEGIDGDTEKGDDVWMCQVFPYHSNLVEGLGLVSAQEREDVASNAHLFGLLQASLEVYVHTLNPYLRTAEGPLIHTSRSGQKTGV